MAKRSSKATETIEETSVVEETPIVEEKRIAVVVNCSGLNLRAKASSESDVLKILNVDTELEVVTIQKNWTKVIVDGITGFVMNDFITLK